MEYIRIGNTYVVRMDRKDEVMTCLSEIADKEDIRFAHLYGLGACDHLKVGCYDVEQQKYHVSDMDGAFEITSLVGNITRKDGRPYLHVHITVADESQKAFGGHLNECVISGTCEMFITALDGSVGRKTDDVGNTGLNIFALRGGNKMKLICYPKCGTCKKAENWLKENGKSYEYRDISKDNPSYDELKEWYEKSGLPIRKLFNTSGRLYKEMQLKDKIPAMSDEEALQLLSTDGMLVKRPIALEGNLVFFGFKEEQYKELL